MYISIKIAGVLTLLIIANCLRAYAAPLGWKGEGELGFSQTTGNNHSNTLLVNVSLGKRLNGWEHGASMGVVNSASRNSRYAESYDLRWKTQYHYTDKRHGFSSARHYDNRFSGYDYQSSIAVGLGSELLNRVPQRLALEGGLGYRRSREVVNKNHQSKPINEIIVLGELNYKRSLTENAYLEQNFRMEAGAENSFLESVTGFKVKLNDRLALKLAYTIKHNSAVPDSIKSTDTLSNVSLNYSF